MPENVRSEAQSTGVFPDRVEWDPSGSIVPNSSANYIERAVLVLLPDV
jgi:hypothetical protein